MKNEKKIDIFFCSGIHIGCIVLVKDVQLWSKESTGTSHNQQRRNFFQRGHTPDGIFAEDCFPA